MLQRFTLRESFPRRAGRHLRLFGMFLVVQSVRRYEEQTFIAFVLALGAIVLFCLAVAKGTW